MEELLVELRVDLEAELVSELKTDADKALLSSKIKGAYLEISYKRNYQEHHTQEFIDKDMRKMYPLIKYLALYDFNLVGAEGQLSHSEPGTSRAWRSRDEILAKIIPFVNVL